MIAFLALHPHILDAAFINAVLLVLVGVMLSLFGARR